MAMAMTPVNDGIGTTPANPVPANLSRSPMATSPSTTATAVPFTRGSTDASMADASGTATFESTTQIQLQTNAFLAFLELDIEVTTSGNTAAVALAEDAPWNLISQINLTDPAGNPIINPISGYGLYLLNKYGTDTGCGFDPKDDLGYVASTGTGATAGSISFRVVIPIENRHRDAFGALQNSSANQRYLLTILANTTANIYTTAPTTAPTSFTYNVTQHYWTAPPASISTSTGSTAVQQTPSGLGTVCFFSYERHNEVSGGGSPVIQFNNVGQYISNLIFVLRNSSGVRDDTDWPSVFNFWINGFQVQTIPQAKWVRDMGRFYGYQSAAKEAAGGLDTGVYVMTQLFGLFDKNVNFGPASQYLATQASTKLQIQGSQWGSGASYLEIYTRTIRPNSGAALFA